MIWQITLHLFAILTIIESVESRCRGRSAFYTPSRASAGIWSSAAGVFTYACPKVDIQKKTLYQPVCRACDRSHHSRVFDIPGEIPRSPSKGGNQVVFSRLLANDSQVGVDIGTNSIKIMQAEVTKQGQVVTNATICPTPPDSVKEGVVVDVPEVASAIQFAMRSAGIKATSGTAAIAGPGVLVRHIQTATVPEQVLRKSIYFEAGKFISSSVEDSVIEFEILGPADEPDQMKVMIVAAPSAMIDSRVNALVQAGLDPMAIDVEAFATFRSLIDYSSDDTLRGSTVALLDIGANHAEINLVCKGALMLTRMVPIAGVSLTNAIKSAENCSDEEAEQRKYELDLNELVESTATPASSPSLRVAQSLLDELLREIRRSINYFQSQLPDASADTNVEKIILCGGTSRLKGLIPYTKSRLNIDTVIGNPDMAQIIGLESGGEISQDDLPLYSVAFGLSVKDMGIPESLRSVA